MEAVKSLLLFALLLLKQSAVKHELRYHRTETCLQTERPRIHRPSELCTEQLRYSRHPEAFEHEVHTKLFSQRGRRLY